MKKFYFLTLALICAFVANAAGDALYMVGYNNSWDPANPTEIPYNAEKGCYYLENVTFTNTTCKISENKGTWNEFNAKAMCIADDETVNIGVAANLYLYSESNINIASTGTFDVYVDLTNKTITLKEPEVTAYPEKLYLIGLFNDWATADKTYALNKTANEGEYLISVTFNEQTYFSVLTNPAADWGSVGTRYVPEGNQDKNINDLTATYNAVVGNNGAWILPAGAYYLLLDINNLTLKVSTDDPTAIDEVAADNAAVEYYNLQGVKVANPENGIFIKKQGNKVAKVVL